MGPIRTNVITYSKLYTRMNSYMWSSDHISLLIGGGANVHISMLLGTFLQRVICPNNILILAKLSEPKF